MSLNKIVHGGRVECEIDGCKSAYVSYSQLAYIRKQAIEAGWQRTKINLLDRWQDRELGSRGTRKIDTCPACTAEINHDAAIRDADAPRLKAEAKARKVAERVAARAEKRAARAAKREAKKAAKQLAAAARSNATIAKREALATARAMRKQARGAPPPQEAAAPS